jgi:hypothetical protein
LLELFLKENEMQCQHRGCNCPETTVEKAGKKFCSDDCAERETTGRHASHCDCGHPSCDAA